MDLTSPDPRPDGRQSATALMIQRGVARLLRAANFAVLPEFTLASGRSSNHYVNCKPVSLSGEGLALLAVRMQARMPLRDEVARFFPDIPRL